MKFGRAGKKGSKPLKVWSIARSILSGIFLTLAILLVFLSISELLVSFLDKAILDNTYYLDWGRAPMIIFLASIPFFIIYLILNLDRFKWSKVILKRFKTSKPPQKIETIDLD